MAPLRASTTKSEWLPDDPTAFVPSRLWKLPFITTWDDSRNQNHPTDSAEEALIYAGDQPDLLAAKALEFGDLGVDGLPFPLLLGRDTGVNGDPQSGFWDFGHVREKGLRIIGSFTQ